MVAKVISGVSGLRVPSPSPHRALLKAREEQSDGTASRLRNSNQGKNWRGATEPRVDRAFAAAPALSSRHQMTAETHSIPCLTWLPWLATTIPQSALARDTRHRTSHRRRNAPCARHAASAVPCQSVFLHSERAERRGERSAGS